jgi:excisionase family DNA binding protein
LVAFGTAKVGKLPTSLLNVESVSGDSVEDVNDAITQFFSSYCGGISPNHWISNPMKIKLLTFKEFAVHLGVSYSTVRRMVAEKKICTVSPRRRPMIPSTEIEKIIPPIKAVVDEKAPVDEAEFGT